MREERYEQIVATLDEIASPHDLNVEKALIGYLINNPESIDDIELSQDDFYSSAHGNIFQAIFQLNEKAEDVDVLTIAEKLEASKKLVESGGTGYVGDLAINGYKTASVTKYAEIIRNKATLRKLIATAGEIQAQCRDASVNPADVIDDAENKILSIQRNRDKNHPVKINKAVQEALEFYGNILDGVGYIKTGFNDLDKIIGGFKGGATYIVAARPGMGKTAFLCSMAHYLAKSSPVYIATLEMPRREIAARLMAIEHKINFSNIHDWTNDDFDKLSLAANTISNQSIIVDHQEGLTLSQLRSRCRRMKRKMGLGAIFIDYLQLMHQKAETREREISILSAGFKSLAKELDVPVIALAQLNRDCEKRHDKRPQLSDLRESGGIEQDADVIMMLYRDEVYDKESMNAGTAELLIRKNRHGAIGNVILTFIEEYMHFVPFAGQWYEAQTKPTKGIYDD